MPHVDALYPPGSAAPRPVKGRYPVVRPNFVLAFLMLAPLLPFNLRAQQSIDKAGSNDSTAFGFHCGMSAEQVVGTVGKSAVSQSPDGVLRLATAAQPDSAFSSYSIVVSPKRGAVMINALGFNPNNSQGADLHGAFTRLQIKLSKIYGPPAQNLNLAGNATFWVFGAPNPPADSGPRHWAAVWNLLPPLKQRVQGIVLDAEQASGYFLLSYECAGIEEVSEQVKTAAVSQVAVRRAFLPATSRSAVVAPAVAAEHQVRYEVTANYYGVKVPVDIAYRDAAGATVKVRAPVPWSITFAAQPGQPLYLSASNPIDYGYIHCTIYLDGALLRTDSDWGVGTVEVKATAAPSKSLMHEEPRR